MPGAVVGELLLPVLGGKVRKVIGGLPDAVNGCEIVEVLPDKRLHLGQDRSSLIKGFQVNNWQFISIQDIYNI